MSRTVAGSFRDAVFSEVLSLTQTTNWYHEISASGKAGEPMFKNYFIVAFRNLLKRKGFSLINILGLATGMAVCLLIVLFIQSELSFDKQHEKAGNIYRVVLERSYPGRSTSYAIIPQSIGAAIKTEYPEVLESTRLFNLGGNGNFFLRIGEKTF